MSMPLDFHNETAGATAQLPLTLGWKPRFTAHAFVRSRCSADARAMIENPRCWPGGRLALIGPEGCGKSHLASIWADETGAARVNWADLNEGNVRDVARNAPLLFEDGDAFFGHCGDARRGEVERAQHHLLNILAEQGGAVLYTGRTPPSRWNIALPDLKSRISAISVFRIEQPDDALIPELFTKLFRDRSITIPSHVAQFLATRTQRSYASIADTVDRLDLASIAMGQPVTVPFAKGILGW